MNPFFKNNQLAEAFENWASQFQDSGHFDNTELWHRLLLSLFEQEEELTEEILQKRFAHWSDAHHRAAFIEACLIRESGCRSFYLYMRESGVISG